MVLAHFIAVAALGLSLVPSVSAWGFPYGSEKVRGVNLGGWLVLEVSYALYDLNLHIIIVRVAMDNPIHFR
jgi:hypothetical protein